MVAELVEEKKAVATATACPTWGGMGGMDM